MATRIIVELSDGLEIRVDNQGVLGTLFLSEQGLGFKAPNTKGPCTKRLPWAKIAPMVDAVGDVVAEQPDPAGS
jgi:hypothetical protein